MSLAFPFSKLCCYARFDKKFILTGIGIEPRINSGWSSLFSHPRLHVEWLWLRGQSSSFRHKSNRVWIQPCGIFKENLFTVDSWKDETNKKETVNGSLNKGSLSNTLSQCDTEGIIESNVVLLVNLFYPFWKAIARSFSSSAHLFDISQEVLNLKELARTEEWGWSGAWLLTKVAAHTTCNLHGCRSSSGLVGKTKSIGWTLFWIGAMQIDFCLVFGNLYLL